MLQKCLRGFTLIELLIVVAIIAILAAIAVPNFLEAQTRSKVSRMQSDMRTIATAIESYAVDNNRPILGKWEIQAAFSIPQGEEEAHRVWNQLTTPVSYLTSVPIQVFVEKGGVGANPNAYYRLSYTYQGCTADSIHGVNATNAVKAIKRLGKSWFLAGYGPSRDFASAPARGVAMILSTGTAPNQLGYPDLFYDATNGTISLGYLMRSSAGVEPVKK